MYPKAVLRALQAGEISLEDAKEELVNHIKHDSDQKPDISSPDYSNNYKNINSEQMHRSWEDEEISGYRQYSELKPELLGSRAFQKRYNCKWSYFTGSMFRAIASENMVVKMAQTGLLSFFGSTGLSAGKLEGYIQSIQKRLKPGQPYGMCLIHNLHDPEVEWKQVELYIKYNVPVVEAAAFPSLTLPLVYYRIKGICIEDGRIVPKRRIISKCSRLEIAKIFLSPPPVELVEQLFKSGMINEDEKRLSQLVSMADDLAIEADSGGHTDQGVSFALIPSVLSLRDQIQQKFNYREKIHVGCGGGIGTPEAVAAAFMLGADFIFTGSINQCTVESGAHEDIKDILQKVSVHDMGVTVAGDMFELGAKAQVVKKYSQFYTRSNRLYSLFMQYGSVEEIPQSVRQDIEKNYFKNTFTEVWKLVSVHKEKTHPQQLIEAEENPRLKMAMIFKWYFNHCTQVTLDADKAEKDNYSIYAGPALGAFNSWVKGTRYESWKNRNVDKIAEQLMNGACGHIIKRNFILSARENQKQSYENTPIAIIGIAGQFPKANTMEEFWKNLSEGRNCISEIPATRWSIEKFYDSNPKAEGKSYSKWMGVLEDADKFDPLFFNISPAEAELMDPQQRLFLENCWSCIEDAGLNPLALSGSRCGVFVGCGTNDYGQADMGKSLNAQGLMGNSPSILSARISYLLDLKGPCIALDTACSSSLVAITEACESLVLNTSDIALAGGVYILPGPAIHIKTSKAGMLSSDGRCYTFDNRANGFVHGEGVGVVLLKRLSDAIRDKDSVYGVIRGWGTNQDGKTNGITAPSVNSQMELEKYVYHKYNIHPETISMIEAHGTGTKLGDPIEVEALTEAFRSFTGEKNYCALGSVKTNIGHLGKAAGIASVIKVLLSLKYQQIPPTINYESVNEHISLKESPFFVNTALKPWDSSKETPRRAAISAFGFSGTNAHIVIEEYLANDEGLSGIRQSGQDSPVLFVLSAKSREQLKVYIKSIKKLLEEQKNINLKKMAYTLQVGREAMDYRMAVWIDSREELLEILELYEKGMEIPKLLTGKVKEKTLDAENNTLKEKIKDYIRTNNLTAIAEMWIKGLKLDWEELYDEIIPGRMNLPTYPFEKDRYWIEENSSGNRSVSSNQAAPERIHPLVHRNTSDFYEHRFTSNFDGQEKFFKDHKVKGEKVLPGAAYLEIARVAVEQAIGGLKGSTEAVRLKNVVWSVPFVWGSNAAELNIRLFREDRGEISFEIYSKTGEAGEPVVHCKGNAGVDYMEETPKVDIEAIKLECSLGMLDSSQCYAFFHNMGMSFGPSHRGLNMVMLGKERVIAHLTLPSELFSEDEKYVLYPGMMDSALQTSVGLMVDSSFRLPNGSDEPVKLVVPFALQEMQVYGKCTPEMWALVQRSKGNTAEDKIEKLDIDLCDKAGNICVKLKAFTNRVLEGGLVKAGAEPVTELLMLNPVWREKTLIKEESAEDFAKRIVILCEPDFSLEQKAYNQENNVQYLILKSEDNEIQQRYGNYACRIFEELKGIVKERIQGKVFVQTVIAAKGQNSLLTGIAGLLRTARMENPKIVTQLIEVKEWDNPDNIINCLTDNAKKPYDDRISYMGNKRYVLEWDEMKHSGKDFKIPWKNGGVYLITGGFGGLGYIFAREIMEKSEGVTIILGGRTLRKETASSRLKDIEKSGSKVIFKQVDVTDRLSVSGLISEIIKEHGKLNGIIHSAGIIQDNYIIKKTQEEFEKVLAPKVSGLVNLDMETAGLSLDFFVLFSSGAGVTGNPGQADYSAANAFMDAYAVYRNELVGLNQRQGRTLSINWPLWKDGGMGVNIEREKAIKQSIGMTAMKTSTGLEAFYLSLASQRSQVMVVEGEMKQLRQYFFESKMGIYRGEAAKSNQVNIIPSEMEANVLEELALEYFKKVVSSVIKFPSHRIEAEAPMEKYGIDSIMIMQLTDELEKVFGSLSKTLFFEYRNISEVTGFFIENHREKLVEMLGISEKHIAENEDEVVSPMEAEDSLKAKPINSQGRNYGFSGEDTERKILKEDIAIIGLAGRYPGADNMQEFWKNLREGRDCITEIPKDRWDHSRYFDETRNTPGKTYGKWGGFLNNIDGFDPLFFNISPKEAESIDPQERLFLECVYETLEDAGYTREALSREQDFGLEGSVGVYVGVMYEEYPLFGAQEQALGGTLALIGSPSSIANRVSYWCNFHGPSIAVDTMCSSSLTAIHLACRSIQNGECRLAVAGGVNVSIHPNKYLLLSHGNFISSKGRCESFGEGGDGYVPGEGVGALLLKPLSRAVTDGDNIYGVIKGSAVNHGGKTNGYTVPNPSAQTSVITRAFRESGINPATISYMETHGTGTALGDPIEITGLVKTFNEYTKNKQFCPIGSVKSNIGHCESAAGIAAVTKVLLQLKYGQLVPSLHAKALNPNIDFMGTPFYVQQKLESWNRPVVEIDGAVSEYPRRAGISSFGAGGSNAHIIIEELDRKADFQINRGITENQFVVVLSAKTEEQLKDRARRLLKVVAEQQIDDASLNSLAYTLQIGREPMEERMAVVVTSAAKLEQSLKNFLEIGDDGYSVLRGQVRPNREMIEALLSSEDIKETIEKWIQTKQYSKLAEFWVKGLNIDWEKLYGDNKPLKISLPSYPFSRKKYWAPGKVEISTRTVSEPVLENEKITKRSCYLQKEWELGAAKKKRSIKGIVVIIKTEETKELAVLISQNLQKSLILDVDELGNHMKQVQNWKEYDGCIDLAGCGRKQSYSLEWFEWLQTLVEYGHKDGMMLLCVTKGLEAYKNNTINTSGATRAGLYRMIQSEYSHLQSRHLDTEPGETEHLIAQQVIEEFLCDSGEAEVCCREGKRYYAFLKEKGDVVYTGSDFAFKEGQVLWITGGTRGLGLLCARYFVKNHGIRRLVLTGREELPPRDMWSSYSMDNSAVSRKIQAIRSLESEGATVSVLAVDLSNAQVVRDCIKEIKKTMGAIGGVIHCAGAGDAENPAMIRKKAESVVKVLEPKVKGLDVLYESLKNEPLQFFILYSSVSAAVPVLGAGRSDYVMANAYMDYFAQAHANECPVISIQWTSWKESGMGEVKSKAYFQTGLLSQRDEEGLSFLEYILSQRPGSVILPAVVNQKIWNPNLLMHKKPQVNDLELNTDRAIPVSEITGLENNLAEAAKAWVKKLISEELRIDDSNLYEDVPFQEFGMDSILLAQIIVRMDRELKGANTDASMFLEYPTIKSFSEYIVKSYPREVRTMLGTKAEQKQVERITVQSSNNGNSKEKIAVVGLACHFPDADNIEEFWMNLKSGKDSIREVPISRWDWHKYYEPDKYAEGKSISKWGAFLRGIEEFDPAFFKISEALAPQIDPLQRQFLEVSAEALADAGYGKKDLWGKEVGVFVGARTANFAYKFPRGNKDKVVGVGQNFIGAHLSHIYNFKGPNMVIDTACSSALTAIHLAVRSIQNGESEAALAGGVEVLLDETAYLGLSDAMVLSPDGRCKTFDASANGIGVGEGCGVLILKSLQKAIKDGNKIYGVIDGSAVNNDGNTMGVTTPNPEAQQELIEKAIRDAAVNPGTMTYVETHGTGTLIGDPIELKGLTKIFTAHTQRKQFCGVGSVKSNIGHLLCAAGAASMVKVLLAVSNGELPPTLHCANPNARFNFKESPLYLVRESKSWTGIDGILRAGISAFGLGGNNAHIIISNEGVPEAQKASMKPMGQKIVFNRKRYWPENMDIQESNRKQNRAMTDISEHAGNDEEFMEFFQVKLEKGV